MRGSSMVVTGVLALLLAVGSYALGRKASSAELRPESRGDSIAELEQRLAERVERLDRRVATLKVTQEAVGATPAVPPPQPAPPAPSALAAADAEEEEFETPESIEAFDATQRLVDDAIASRSPWDEARREAFRAKTRFLTRSQLQSVMSGLMVAINTGKLQVSALPPL
jgi:hypothetical protein